MQPDWKFNLGILSHFHSLRLIIYRLLYIHT
jgi:hypothetical protein